MSGTLMLTYSWQQAMSFIAVAVVIGAAALLMAGTTEPMRLLGAIAGSAFVGWMGVHMLTSSTRLDAQGITVHAPVHPFKRNASIAWKDMAAAEIVPCGWYAQGLRLVSGTGADIVIPLNELRTPDALAIIARVAAHPSVRMHPDAKSLLAQAKQIGESRSAPKMRASLIPDRVASAVR